MNILYRQSYFFSIIACLVLTVSPEIAFSQAKFDREKLDRFFDLLETNSRMMGSVTLSKGDKIIYRRSLGYRTISDKDKEKADSNTEYRIGSITKVYTAVMIWQLIEEKKLTLDTNISGFFPDFPNAKAITIAHLLSHTSGLRDYTEGVSYDREDPSAWIFQPQHGDSLVKRISGLKPDSAPGEKQRYSNTNYTLLGYIVEKVTRSTYAKELNKRISNRIGLKGTYYEEKKNPARNVAISYVYDNGKWNTSYGQELSAAAGAGGIISTPNDVAKFIAALGSFRLIRKSSFDRMTSAVDTKFPGSHLGIAKFKLRGIDKYAISKQGGIDAFTSNVVYVPEDQFAMALAINGNNYPMPKIFWYILDIYYNRQVELPSFEPIELSTEDLTRLEGTFELAGTSMKIAISVSGGTLSAQATGQEPFKLVPTSKTTFVHTDSGIIIEFRPNSDGLVKDFMLYQGRNSSSWEKRK